MLAAALTIARRDEVEANQLVHDHSMDGNRPGDIDDIVQENARLLREMQEQETAGTNNFFFLEQFATPPNNLQHLQTSCNTYKLYLDIEI